MQIAMSKLKNVHGNQNMYIYVCVGLVWEQRANKKITQFRAFRLFRGNSQEFRLWEFQLLVCWPMLTVYVYFTQRSLQSVCVRALSHTHTHIRIDTHISLKKVKQKILVLTIERTMKTCLLFPRIFPRAILSVVPPSYVLSPNCLFFVDIPYAGGQQAPSISRTKQLNTDRILCWCTKHWFYVRLCI